MKSSVFHPGHQRRTGRMRRRLILWWSFVLTGWTCILLVMHASLASTPRHKMDREIRRWARRLLSLLHLNVTVSGDYPAQLNAGRPTIIMCNHSSLYDIPLMFLAFPGSIRMLAKKELFRVPLLGAGMKASEMISIDRHDRQQALDDLRHAREKMQDGIVLWIAPEGTRSRDGKLLPFKKGGFHLAIETGATIVPVVVNGIHRVMPAKSFAMNLGCDIEVRVGQSVDATRFSRKTRTDLMQHVRSQMQSLLNDHD